MDPYSLRALRAFVVCGPTASGKSELADLLADELSLSTGRPCPALVVDSMQVYREIPGISNQRRRRPAYLRGIASVTEEWSVARHRGAADDVLGRLRLGPGDPFVLDAGTGMYLNAMILALRLAPKVPSAVREEALRTSVDDRNPRRASRARELALVGAEPRASVWDGPLRFETKVIYLRPDRPDLDRAIGRRSEAIARAGLDEAVRLLEMRHAGLRIQPTVADAIGVRELLALAGRATTPQEATAAIAARTRRLARRQARWFDKLARTLRARGAPAPVLVAESPADLLEKHTLHDIIGL